MGSTRIVFASALLAGYVGVVIATYVLQRDFWMTCLEEGPAYSDAGLTFLVSGPLLAAAVAFAKFDPVWVWVTAVIAALVIGYYICARVSLAASTGTPSHCTDTTGPIYTADATRACLEGTSADVDPDPDNVDYPAVDAEYGAIRAEFDGREVIVSFWANKSEAEIEAAIYVTGYEPVEQIGNAVLAWTNAPTDEERKTVVDCLS